MLPILPVGELAGALGYGPGGWIRLQVTKEGKLLLASYGIVWEWEATQNVQYVDVTGLDIVRHWGYWIYFRLKNPTASTWGLRMFVNGDYTDTKYWYQRVSGSGTTAVAARINAASIVGCDAEGQALGIAFLTIGPGGFPFAVSQFVRGVTTPTEITALGWFYTISVSNITSLRFDSTAAGGIGAGSKILIYKLK